MASAVDKVKVVERRRVSLPSESVSPAEITLTYFDIALLPIAPIQQLFFYDFSGSTQDFRDSYFPQFEQSVSLSLTLFYPLAGRLVPLTDSYPGDHVIRYSDGDSVSLILAESRADFTRLVGNEAKEAKEFHSLVPPLLLECSSVGLEGKPEAPLSAFQVTVFPHSGISFGFTVKHSVADGSALTHFLKSLASIFKAGGDVSVVKNLPIHDRTLLRHLEQLKRNHLEQEAVKNDQTRKPLTESEPVEAQLKRIVRSTFVLTRAHIQKLCNKISATGGGRVGPKLSAFVVTCAYVWTCLAKSRDVAEGKNVYFGFPVDCRPRLDPPVPASYFGNCVTMAEVVEASQAELTEENGLVAASEAIHRAIRRLDEGIVKQAHAWRWRWRELKKAKPSLRPLSVHGSPRFRTYETDFGWGRPRKFENISIDYNEAMSLAESGDEEGGVEIGMVGPEDEMLRFTSVFEEGLYVC